MTWWEAVAWSEAVTWSVADRSSGSHCRRRVVDVRRGLILDLVQVRDRHAELMVKLAAEPDQRIALGGRLSVGCGPVVLSDRGHL
jgi:hypothetical protein